MPGLFCHASGSLEAAIPVIPGVRREHRVLPAARPWCGWEGRVTHTRLGGPCRTRLLPAGGGGGSRGWDWAFADGLRVRGRVRFGMAPRLPAEPTAGREDVPPQPWRLNTPEQPQPPVRLPFAAGMEPGSGLVIRPGCC